MLASGPRGLGLLTFALLLSVSHAGAATLTVSSSVGGAPTGINYVNFDNLTLGDTGGTSGGVTVTMSPDAQAVQGTTGTYAAPYLSNNNGTLFGDSNNGPDTTTYLTSGSNNSNSNNAQIKLVFPNPEEYMGLLWGSVDNYNTLSFYSGGTLIGGPFQGTDVFAGANGDQGVNGTYYVNINSNTFFDTVIATSTQYAFEFDNVSFNPTNIGGGGQGGTPLPAAAWLFGSVLAGSGLFMRRRRKGAPVSTA